MNQFMLAAAVGVAMFLAGVALPYLLKQARRKIARIRRVK